MKTVIPLARTAFLILLVTRSVSLWPQQSPEAAKPVINCPPKASPADEVTGALGDVERTALTFTRYDLDLHLRPEESAISVLAHVTVRNDGDKSLSEIALQVSSSLHWDGVSLNEEQRTEKLAYNQHLLQTDADHTGGVSEVVIRLPRSLPVHGMADLSLLYSGEIRVSTAALERVNASSSGAPSSNWDLISPEGTYLRGFGDVLWYPVSSPQVFLADGPSLLSTLGDQMLRQAPAKVALRLTVEYIGEAPGVAFFCGRKQPLTSSRDNPEAPVAESPGVATAEFPAEDLGFHSPSLLVTDAPVALPGTPIEVVSNTEGFAQQVSTAYSSVTPLLKEWFGQAGETLTVVDHPGVSFADRDLLVTPFESGDGAALSAELVPSLVRIRLHSLHPWLDQGLAQFFSLLWVERTRGRPVALADLEEQSHAVALAESFAESPANTDRSLLMAADPVRYKSKAAFVFWMLRDMLGDKVLKQALQRYAREPRIDRDPAGFQKLLEEISGKSLGWFFNDWVYNDRGLPELSIVSAVPRPLPSSKAGDSGWLVAVEVRNDGGAAAEVPVTVRSGTLTASERLRINAHAVSSVRIVFQGEPQEVQVNDGTVPEMISNTHIREISAN